MSEKKKPSVAAADFANGNSSNTFYKFAQTVITEEDILTKAFGLDWNQMKPILERANCWDEIDATDLRRAINYADTKGYNLILSPSLLSNVCLFSLFFLSCFSLLFDSCICW